ncbi:MAG TPA: DUF3501 family protein [Gemmataceae bacterium]|nr:DUF3501 family protein [Gemmataceae bacterium]
MQPLTLDDLLPLEEYSSRRREFFESLHRYLDRYRRLRIGPRLTLLFENRQTLWFRVQEVVRVARLADPARLREELALYNRLLPGRDRLQAALLIEVADEARLVEELAPWQALMGEHLRLHAGEGCFPATLLTCRPEDRCCGTAHWIQFAIDAAGRKHLADLRKPAYVEVTLPSYQHQSPPLPDEVRQSLVEDLELSDRDAA